VTITIFRRSKSVPKKMDLAPETPRPFDYFLPAGQNVPYNPYGSTPHEPIPVLPSEPYF
jgi:hypothetical protein